MEERFVGRTSMKLNSIAVRLFILCLVVFVLAGAAFLWWKDGISAVNPTDKTPVVFAVSKGEGVRSISTRLGQANLIRSPTSFYILVKLKGIERQIQAGDFRLTRAMDAGSIAEELTHGIVDVWVTTLEGWRVEEVAAKLAKELDIPEQEFLKYAKEGYMFPDTYLVPQDATPAGVATLFTQNLNKKITDQIKKDMEKSGLTLHDVLTLASIVEREGRSDEDRPVIAGILFKRLKAGWPLETDATLQYALGYQPFEKTWWKKSLTSEDKKVKSPYNTYERTGLPPGPIANPGIASIRAVVYPVETEYWFYLHDPKGNVHYAKTGEEHAENITKYL